MKKKIEVENMPFKNGGQVIAVGKKFLQLFF